MIDYLELRSTSHPGQNYRIEAENIESEFWSVQKDPNASGRSYRQLSRLEKPSPLVWNVAIDAGNYQLYINAFQYTQEPPSMLPVFSYELLFPENN